MSSRWKLVVTFALAADTGAGWAPAGPGTGPEQAAAAYDRGGHERARALWERLRGDDSPDGSARFAAGLGVLRASARLEEGALAVSRLERLHAPLPGQLATKHVASVAEALLRTRDPDAAGRGLEWGARWFPEASRPARIAGSTASPGVESDDRRKDG